MTAGSEGAAAPLALHGIHPPACTASVSTPVRAGDYWPGEAELLLEAITSEASGGGKGSGGAAKPTSTSRTKTSLKAKSRAGPATGTATEELFRRLGEAIQVRMRV